MALARTDILRLYDYVARRIPLDLAAETSHLPQCSNRLTLTGDWIAAHAPEQEQTWQRWLAEMCFDCDCALVLQLTTFASEPGATEGINMRRCSSCNQLLALYQVTRSAAADPAPLIAWAQETSVPAYLLTLIERSEPRRAAVAKVSPSGGTFQLTAQQFYGAVLRNIERHHRCPFR
jgi:hypothetical protein